MSTCWLLRFLTIAIFITGSNAFLWSPATEDVIKTCVGDDVSIPWSFTTSPNETVMDITWYLEENDGNTTVFAVMIEGEFFTHHRQNVQPVDNAGFLVQTLTTNDTGLYSVRVNIKDSDDRIVTMNRSAFVEVSAPPVLDGERFEAHYRPKAVRDNVTGSWYVMLDCGRFQSLGYPPVLVEWQTPSGTVYADFNYQDGFFLFPLMSVESGNHSCSLLDQSPAKRCLGNDSELLGEARVYVESTNVKLSVLEAAQSETTEILRLQMAQIQNLTQRVTDLETLKHQSGTGHPATCLDVNQYGGVTGVHTLLEGNMTISVFCDQDTDGGGWTVFLRRQDGSVDFYLNWTEYTTGFGFLNGEHWLGLEKLHVLTSARKYMLRVDLEAFDGTRASAGYGGFRIGDSSTNYTLDFDTYLDGRAGDSLSGHKGFEFATQDHGRQAPCAVRFLGAWWYNDCYESNLNGVYSSDPGTKHIDGIVWESFESYDSLKRAEMKIRPM